MPLQEAIEFGLKAGALIIAGVVGLYQLRSVLPAQRSRLKTDLEILRQIDSSNPLYAQVKAHIDAQLERVYGDTLWRRPLVYSWSEAVFGLLWSTGFGAWALFLSSQGLSWWSVLPATLVPGGIASIVRGFDGSRIFDDAGKIAKGALRNLASAQESHFADHGRYAATVEALAYFTPPEGVTVRVVEATEGSWGALAKHDPTGLEFGMYSGPTPPEFVGRPEGSPFPVSGPKGVRFRSHR